MARPRRGPVRRRGFMMSAAGQPSPGGPEQLGARVVRRCLELGFALAGIAPSHAPIRTHEFERWIAQAKHGEMSYLAEHAAIRTDLQRFVPGAAAVVMVADQYADRNQAPGTARDLEGRVGRYAHGRDYHDVLKRRLHALCDELRAQFPDERFRAFVDTAPVLERDFAAAAGLGWVGKHTLVINPRLGSWFVLGGIATTLRLAPPVEQAAVPDACGTCTRCIDACPTGAITPYSVDARRCISYLTIEHRSVIDPALADQSADWIFGCDVCQQVCPHNSPRGPGSEVGEARPEYRGHNDRIGLMELLGWTPQDRRGRLSGSAMKRATLAMLKRNAIVALANAAAKEGTPPRTRGAIVDRLRAVAADSGEEVMVREQARLALRRLEPDQA